MEFQITSESDLDERGYFPMSRKERLKKKRKLQEKSRARKKKKNSNLILVTNSEDEGNFGDIDDEYSDHNVIEHSDSKESDIDSDEQLDNTNLPSDIIDADLSSEDENNDSICPKNKILIAFQTAANQTYMNQTQIEAMLNFLRKYKGDMQNMCFPKKYKTLFHCSNNVVLEKRNNYDYFYFGLENQILHILKLYPVQKLIELKNKIELVWGSDGLQLCKSNTQNAWPILAYIHNLKPHKVFSIAIAAGPTTKPDGIDYLNDFVTELKHLMKNGFTYKKQIISVIMKAGIFDAPARAMVKRTLGHNSTFGCDQCNIRGKHEQRTMVFLGTNYISRTNSSFRNKLQPQHHKKCSETKVFLNTPLLNLNVDIIKKFPPDFMHQGGGTMKKLLDCWFSGPRNPYKIKKIQAKIIDNRIKYISENCIPVDLFSRKLRTTKEMGFYKFTELRQILLYTGKVIFLDIVKPEYYQNFLYYSVACTLMSDIDNAQPYVDHCRVIMDIVVKGFQKLYGDIFMTYNAHSNLHFPDVVEEHGSLSTISGYKFENHLRILRLWVRSSGNQCLQLVKGIKRVQNSEKKIENKTQVIFSCPPKNIFIDNKKKICYEVIEVNQIAQMVSVKKYDGSSISNFFDLPSESFHIGCYLVKRGEEIVCSISVDNILSCRRGIKIALNKMQGLTGNITSYDFYQMVLHNEGDDIFY